MTNTSILAVTTLLSTTSGQGLRSSHYLDATNSRFALNARKSKIDERGMVNPDVFIGVWTRLLNHNSAVAMTIERRC